MQCDHGGFHAATGAAKPTSRNKYPADLSFQRPLHPQLAGLIHQLFHRPGHRTHVYGCAEEDHISIA